VKKVKIKPLTPVWTGNLDHEGSLLQDTGIVGSLRWWFETIIRSIDGHCACSVVDDKKCPQKKNEKQAFCSACLIFGATGLRRIFRLSASGGRQVFRGNPLNIRPSGRGRGWYLGSGIVEEINLEIVPLDRDFREELVLLPLILASKWGGIGAKTQHGYGVVKIEDCPEIDFDKFREAIENTGQKRLSELGIELRHENSNGLPNLKEMFFAKVQFEITNTDWWKRVDGLATYENDPRMINWVNSGSVPIVPAIKNWLRYKEGRKVWEIGNKTQDVKIESWLFGTLDKCLCPLCLRQVKRDNRRWGYFWCKNCRISLSKTQLIELTKQSSKINISCAYPVDDAFWEFRIWGWIPKNDLPAGFDRNDFLDNLKQALEGSGSVTVPWNKLLGNQTRNHRLKVWREFDSPRDTVKPNEGNISDYLQSLLNGEGCE